MIHQAWAEGKDEIITVDFFQLAGGWVFEMDGTVKFMVEKVDPGGNYSYELAKGVCRIYGLYYFFDENGIMQTGLKRINGYLYYLEEIGLLRGTIHTGYISVNGDNYYCDPRLGGMAIKILD